MAHSLRPSISSWDSSYPETGFWEIAPAKSTSHQLVNLTGDAQTAEVRNGRRPNTSLEMVPGKLSHSKFALLSSLKSSILPTLSTIRRTTDSIGSRPWHSGGRAPGTEDTVETNFHYPTDSRLLNAGPIRSCGKDWRLTHKLAQFRRFILLCYS